MSLDLSRAATVTVESTLLPPMTFNIGDELASDSGPLTKLLRPRVTVRAGSAVLYRAQPAGDPDQGVPLGIILAGLVAVGAYVLLARVL